MLKRYSSSRRIYDTELSRYVSIAEVRSRLLRGETVTDETGADVTGAVLARVIMNDVEACGSVPTTAALRQFILYYESTAPRTRVPLKTGVA